MQPVVSTSEDMHSPYRNAFICCLRDGCGHTHILDLISHFHTEAVVTWLKGIRN